MGELVFHNGHFRKRNFDQLPCSNRIALTPVMYLGSTPPQLIVRGYNKALPVQNLMHFSCRVLRKPKPTTP